MGPTCHPPYLCSFLPAPQCLRRYIDERGKEHLYNAAKYLSAMTTVALKVAYSQNHSQLWLALFATSARGTAIYANFWDLVNDWGLLRRRASAPWLRNNRVLTNAWVYYVAMVRRPGQGPCGCGCGYQRVCARAQLAAFSCQVAGWLVGRRNLDESCLRSLPMLVTEGSGKLPHAGSRPGAEQQWASEGGAGQVPEGSKHRR